MTDRRHDTIVFLLERMEDALMERSSTNGRSTHESVSLMPGAQLLATKNEPYWNEAFRELDRCLTRMRNQGQQQAVTYQGGTCSLGCAAWHVNAWFVQVEHRQTVARQTVKGKHGKRGTVQIPVVEILRHRDARKPKADAGVAWLVGEYAWRSGAVQAALAALAKEPAGLRLAA